MRLSLALAFCAIYTSSSAQDAPIRVKDASGAAVSTAGREPEKTIVYKTSVAAPRCDSVIDDKALRELVQRQAREIGVDEKLALVILKLESKDGADVNSPKGARGPMQLMPATAAQYGVQDVCNPEQNVRATSCFSRTSRRNFPAM